MHGRTPGVFPAAQLKIYEEMRKVSSVDPKSVWNRCHERGRDAGELGVMVLLEIYRRRRLDRGGSVVLKVCYDYD